MKQGGSPPQSGNRTATPKTFPVRKDSLDMLSHERRQSTSSPDPSPDSASVLRPAVIALSFTTILIQVQGALQGSAHDLLPFVIAVLLLMAGAVRSNHPQA